MYTGHRKLTWYLPSSESSSGRNRQENKHNTMVLAIADTTPWEHRKTWKTASFLLLCKQFSHPSVFRYIYLVHLQVIVPQNRACPIKPRHVREMSRKHFTFSFPGGLFE